jgi:hypothetical protein
VISFTEFVRFFKIRFGKLIKIRIEYKLWFLSRIVPLQDTFLNIPDEIEIKFKTFGISYQNLFGL